MAVVMPPEYRESRVLDAEAAIGIASEFAVGFAAGAVERDANRLLPHEEIRELADSRILAITVPSEYGGADLPATTVAEVFRLIASADPNIAQIPHSHFVYVNQLRLRANHEQKARLFSEVIAGKMFGNAQSEIGTKHVRDYHTTLTPDGPGRWRLNGTKFYCTGALFADWIPVLAHLGTGGPIQVAWVHRDAEGLSIVDDWNGMGQRVTASGTVRLDDVLVTADWITDYAVTFDGPQTAGAFAQLLHAAIDAGIARAALDEAAEFLRTKSRPYPDAGVDRAADDPVIVHAFGEMELEVRAAEALLETAGRAVEQADTDLTERTAGSASLAVAAARAATTRASVRTASRLFEVAGTRAAMAPLDLDRHWRNARTHTLHDPAEWKVQHLGRWAVDSALPPRHGQL